jgi:transposase InsO family protein
VCQRPETTFVFNTTDLTYLAIAKMVPRFVRTTTSSTRKFKICCGSGGMFLKMDRSYPLATITLAIVQKFF